MHIISKKALIEFWKSRKGDAQIAERDLSTWHKIVEKAEWVNFAALKESFRSADQVGHCVVFDVGNNRYRLIALVRYRSDGRGTLFVRRVMDHAEYDKQKWREECGCYSPPPKKKTVTINSPVEENPRKSKPRKRK